MTTGQAILPPPAFKPVTFLTKEVAPPTPLFIDETDFLYIRYWATRTVSTIEIHARLLRVDGEIVPILHLFTPAVGSDWTALSLELATGYLLSLTILSRYTGNWRGNFYCIVAIARPHTAFPLVGNLLLQGYVSYMDSLAWPPGTIEPSTKPPGYLNKYPLENPAAGANLAYTVGNYAKWLIRQINIPFVTSSTAADRRLTLLIDDGTDLTFQSEPAPIQTASLTRTYQFISDWPIREAAFDANGYIRLPLPKTLYVKRNHRIQTSIANIQTADDISQVRATVEEWVEI